MGRCFYALVGTLFLVVNYAAINASDSGDSYGRGLGEGSFDSAYHRSRQAGGLLRLILAQEKNRQLELRLRIAQKQLKTARTNLKIARLNIAGSSGSISADLPLGFGRPEIAVDADTRASAGAILQPSFLGATRPASSGAVRISHLSDRQSPTQESANAFGSKVVDLIGISPRATFGIGLLAGATLVFGAAYLKGGLQTIKDLFSSKKPA